MSGTFTWTGTLSTNWNQAGNWTNGGTVSTTVPNSSTAIAIDPGNEGTTSAGSPVISDASDTVASLTVEGAGHDIVGGNANIGDTPGTGGTLDATGSIDITSTNGGGGLVGGPDAVITTPDLTLAAGGIAGGGGVFSVGDFINSGEIQADGGNYGLGALVVTGGSITGSGSLEIDSQTFGVGNSSTLELNSTTSQLANLVVDPGHTANLLIDTPSFGGSLNLFNASTCHGSRRSLL